MKLLIVCVGTRDPYVDKEDKTKGPILSFLDYIHKIDEYKDYRPDKVYLLSTAKKSGSASYTQERGEKTKNVLEKEYGLNVYTRLIDISDPTDYSKLLPEMKNIIIRIMDELKGQDVKYLLNVSPGLPQMQAVWFALENAGVIKAYFLQVKNPMEEPDEKKRIRRIDISPLFEDNLIKSGLNFLRNYSFKPAADAFFALRDQTHDLERSEAAELLGNLSIVYAQWDNFDYEGAWSNLSGNVITGKRNLLEKSDKFKSIRNSISDQNNVFRKLNEGVLKESLIDLYQNAIRKHEQGQSIDCVMRAYSIYEKMVVDKALEIIKRETKFRPDPSKFQTSIVDEMKKSTELKNFTIKCCGLTENIPYVLELLFLY